MHFMVKNTSGLLSAICLLVSCNTYTEEELVPLDYDCDDVVVIGRAEVTSYTSKTTPDDILGHGVFELNITIKQLRHGDEPRKIVPAFYHAHNEARDDKDLLFVLSPTGERYEVVNIMLWDGVAKRVLAKSCS